jgi:hypothetical protein
MYRTSVIMSLRDLANLDGRIKWVAVALVALAVVVGLAVGLDRLRDARAKKARSVSDMSLLGASAHAKALATPRYNAQDFQKECLSLVQQHLFRRAAQSCDKFTAQADLAARAHSTLAAVYTARAIQDLPASVQHAAQAAKMGDARGKFLLAAHMLSGAYQPFDESLLRRLLNESQSGGVAAARIYLQALEDSQNCRITTKVMPLGLPVFCMFRAELQQALRQKGLRLKAEDLQRWQDNFAPGEVLANARDAELAFDVSPSEEIHRVASLSYQIVDEQSANRWAELHASLSRKYGKPKSASTGQELVWDMGDGTQVRLFQEDAWQLRLSYEHTKRMVSRQEHLSGIERQAREDRVLAEAEAL